jgi:hypothetical protein
MFASCAPRSAVFSGDLDLALAVARQLDTGMCHIDAVGQTA